MNTDPEFDDSFVSEELLNSAAVGSAMAAPLSVVSILFVLAALYGQSPLIPTLLWGGTICAIASAMFICSTYRQGGRRSLFSKGLHNGLTLLLGFLWGSSLFVMAPEPNIYTASILTVIVVGVCISSLLVQLSNPPAWILMFIPAIGIHSIYLYTHDQTGYFQLASVSLIFSTLIAIVAIRIKNYLLDNIEARHALQEKNEEILDKNARLYKLAHYDGLTGTANRKLLITAANDYIEKLSKSGKTCGFLLIDLDHFKHLNDTMGHAAGDELLSIVGARLRNCVRANDIVARIGGDEFGVLITDLDEGELAEDIADKIIRSLDLPQRVLGALLNSRASIGISYYPRHGISITELMNNADLALQSAKKEGRGKYQVCTNDLQLAAVKKLTVESELRRALRKQSIGYHFQPIISTTDGKIRAAEALVRLMGSEETSSNAEEIMQVSSAVGLSEELSRVLFQSLEEQGQEMFQTLPDLEKISINLSPLELRSATPVKHLEDIFRRGTFTPDQLQIEITEQSVLERGADQARDAIDRLSAMGLSIIMDDFGTGYSSLTHLKLLPIDGIKIDKSFVRELNNDLRDAAIVRSLVGMCKGLGLKVTAEGVEDFAQFETLRRLGCDYVQGYLFFKALAVEELARLVKEGPHETFDWAQQLLVHEPDPAETPEIAEISAQSMPHTG